MNENWNSGRWFVWGMATLCVGGGLLSGGLYPLLQGDELPQVTIPTIRENAISQESEPLLEMREEPLEVPIPHLVDELSFVSTAPHPDSGERHIGVQLKKSGHMKWVQLPARLDLVYTEEGKLQFTEGESEFWVELEAHEKGVTGKTGVALLGDVRTASWQKGWSEPPIATPADFPEASPFRSLGDLRWVGSDLLALKALQNETSPRFRLEGNEGVRIEVKEGECLYWQGGRWSREKSPVVIRVKGIHGQKLELEGWADGGFARLALPLQNIPTSRSRYEELFTTIRIRSERQMSCVLEKQCLILRAGDWAVKLDGRWRVLRRPEERTHFLQERSGGEVFVLDRIEVKGQNRIALGMFYSANRTQSQALTLVAATPKQPPKTGRLNVRRMDPPSSVEEIGAP